MERVDPDLPPTGKYPMRKAFKALLVELASELPLEPKAWQEALEAQR